jgi:ABC-type Fe3+-hydroxamate transport system substrate-binding protein
MLCAFFIARLFRIAQLIFPVSIFGPMSDRVFTCVDQMGNKVIVPIPPKRIISLVPSQTELLADLGLEDQVVGVTKFCVHPSSWKQKPRVGGTKLFNYRDIDHLAPDLLIGNKEENYREGIEELQKKYPVWMSDIETLSDATAMIRSIGALTNRTLPAQNIANSIEDAFKHVRKVSPMKTLYLIWKKPWMAAGKNTFIDCMLSRLGLINAVERSRYPELSESEMKQIDPDLILLSSEPYPFKVSHREAMKSLCPKAKIVLVDGEMFSWYGSRLLNAPAYFETLSL